MRYLKTVPTDPANPQAQAQSPIPDPPLTMSTEILPAEQPPRQPAREGMIEEDLTIPVAIPLLRNNSNISMEFKNNSFEQPLYLELSRNTSYILNSKHLSANLSMQGSGGVLDYFFGNNSSEGFQNNAEKLMNEEIAPVSLPDHIPRMTTSSERIDGRCRGSSGLSKLQADHFGHMKEFNPYLPNSNNQSNGTRPSITPPQTQASNNPGKSGQSINPELPFQPIESVTDIYQAGLFADNFNPLNDDNENKDLTASQQNSLNLSLFRSLIASDEYLAAYNKSKKANRNSEGKKEPSKTQEFQNGAFKAQNIERKDTAKFGEDLKQGMMIEEPGDSKENTENKAENGGFGKEDVKYGHDSEDLDPNRPICTCNKTQCLKLYCICFRKGYSCCSRCKCVGCLNTKQNYELVTVKRTQKIVRKDTETEQIYCNCRMNFCEKSYCVCFRKGRACTSLCKCFHCKNRHGAKK